MQKTKYNVGDLVWAEEIYFIDKTHLSVKKVEPFLAKIIKATKTSTFDGAYVLEDRKGTKLYCSYWESSLKLAEDVESFWKMWGTI